MMSIPNLHRHLVRAIERFQAEREITDSTLGVYIARDTRLIGRVKAGGANLTLRRYQDILAYIEREGGTVPKITIGGSGRGARARTKAASAA